MSATSSTSVCLTGKGILTPNQFTLLQETLQNPKNMTTDTIKETWAAFRSHNEEDLRQVSDENWNKIYTNLSRCKAPLLLWETLSLRIILMGTWDEVIEHNLSDLIVLLGRAKKDTDELDKCTRLFINIVQKLETTVRWREKVGSINSFGVVTLLALEVISEKEQKELAHSLSLKIIEQVEGPTLFGIVPLYVKPRGGKKYQTILHRIGLPKKRLICPERIKYCVENEYFNPRLMIQITTITLAVLVVGYAIYSRYFTATEIETWSPGFLWCKEEGAFAIPHSVKILYHQDGDSPEIAHLETNLGHYLCVNRVCKLVLEQFVPEFLKTIATIK
jgi:hypothetical protein